MHTPPSRGSTPEHFKTLPRRDIAKRILITIPPSRVIDICRIMYKGKSNNQTPVSIITSPVDMAAWRRGNPATPTPNNNHQYKSTNQSTNSRSQAL